MSNFNDLKDSIRQALTESKNDVDGASVDPNVDILLDKMALKMAGAIDRYVTGKLESLKTVLKSPGAFNTPNGPADAGVPITTYNPRQ